MANTQRSCKQCGSLVEGASRRYCSRNCYAAAQRAPGGHKTCPWCNKDFHHRANIHCSSACALAAKAAKKKPAPKPRPPKSLLVCEVCSKGFLAAPSEERKYCSRSCYARAVSKRQTGAGHHNYKDGRSRAKTAERQQLRRHKGYAEWRNAVYARDGHKCRACMAGGELHAHHHAPWVDAPKLRLKVSNGITLCGECHRLWHAYERKGLFSGKESLLQGKVKAALEEYGFYVFNVPGSAMGNNGIPDLLVCYRGVFGGLECKVYPNYLTENQRIQGKRIQASGGVFMVVQSEDDVGRVIELFETKAAGGSWIEEESDAQVK